MRFNLKLIFLIGFQPVFMADGISIHLLGFELHIANELFWKIKKKIHKLLRIG